MEFFFNIIFSAKGLCLSFILQGLMLCVLKPEIADTSSSYSFSILLSNNL